MRPNLFWSLGALAALGASGTAQTTFEGLKHTALGSAQLSPRATGLMVGNLDPSGTSGVLVDLGEVQSHILQLDTPPPSNLPTGAELRMTPRGELGGVLDQDIWTVRVTDMGNQFGIGLDVSNVQPAAIRVDAVLDGVVVDSIDLTPSMFTMHFVLLGDVKVVDPYWPQNDDCVLMCGPEEPSPVALVGGSGPVLADQIIVTASGGQVPTGALSSMRVQSDFPGFVLEREEIGQFDLEHHALGTAEFDTAGGTVTVNNIGSSGLDGVCVDLGESETHGLMFAPPPVDTLPDGAYLDLTTFGQLSGVPDQEIWSMRMTDMGNQLGVSLATSLVQPGYVRVDTVENGIVTDTEFIFPPPLDFEIIIYTPPSGCIVGPFVPVGSECIATISLDTSQPVTIAGHMPVNATQILIATGQLQESVDSLSRTDITGGGGLTSFKLLNESLSPIAPIPYCTAQQSSSGCLAGITTSSVNEQPISGQADYSVIATNVQSQRPGILFFGSSGPAAIPFLGGTLCMNPPLIRGPIQFSGGAGPASCQGALAQVINNGGPWDLGPGGTLQVQAWNRDSGLGGGFDSALSSALRIDFQ